MIAVGEGSVTGRSLFSACSQARVLLTCPSALLCVIDGCSLALSAWVLGHDPQVLHPLLSDLPRLTVPGLNALETEV